MKLFYAQEDQYNTYYLDDQPLPGMCTATHKGYHCAMIYHPENPDQHYFVQS